MASTADNSEDTYKSLVYTVQTSRVLFPTVLSQAYQLRSRQILQSNEQLVGGGQASASSQESTVENGDSFCRKCFVPWIAGYNVKIRTRIGSDRISGGLSRRQRIRRERKLQNRLDYLAAKRGRIPVQSKTYRPKYVICVCKNCNTRKSFKVAEGAKGTARDRRDEAEKTNEEEIEIRSKMTRQFGEVAAATAVGSASITNQEPKKKKKKKVNSLQEMIAKGREKSKSKREFSLEDFML